VKIDRPLTILCVSDYFKGTRFIETCKEQGCRTLLLTIEKLLSDPWPRQCLDEVWALPSFSDAQAVINSVSYLARTEQIDRIAPLDDFDVELVARLREHLRIPGMGETTARYFRDKLAMRKKGVATGIRVPRFVHVLNYDRIREFLAEVPAPWMLKPRAEASAVGIKKLSDPDEVWRHIHALGDKQSTYLIEQMIPGDVYHVDSIVSEREVVFAEMHRYRKPLFDVAHSGGVFGSSTLPRESEDSKRLAAANRQVLKALGFVRGVAHTEFIKSTIDGEFYFLETAARVGGAHIAELVEASTGVNLWAEWAKIEITQGEFEYVPPSPRRDYGGVIVALSRQERPDTSAYNDPEIYWRLTEKKNHVGFVLRADSPERIDEIIDSYSRRIENDFLASMPAPDKPTS
jgi:biotin carboxylase